MRIGELSRLTGVSVSALRYYEQVGLLTPALRTESGYREYEPEAVERVRFILRAKELGFALKEIRAVLALYDRGELPCDRVSILARKKIARIERQIAKLRARQTALRSALHQWASGSLEEAPFCMILNAPENSDRRYSDMARTIEVFTAGCPLCDETLKRVREAVAACGCTVVERTPDSPEAQQYGVTAVPTIVADGQLIFTGTPTLEQAIALLRR